MSNILAPRVQETTTTTGTGTLDLGGAVAGYQTFVAGIGTGNTCYYTIIDGVAWEVGIGTVTDATPDTLSRTAIFSTNANALLNLAAGTKTVFCSPVPINFVPGPLPGTTTQFLRGDGVFSASGQLPFPTAQNSSADANTLDDYEEGSWTPGDGSGAGLSITNNSARYVKIGTLVYCHFDVTYPSTASGADAVLNGLPFTSVGLNGQGGVTTYNNSTKTMMITQDGGGSTLRFYLFATAATVTNANLTGSVVRGVLFYRTV